LWDLREADIKKKRKMNKAIQGDGTYMVGKLRHGVYEDSEEYVRSRLSGIEYMSDKCYNLTLLDLGCAEGLVSRQFVDYGISSVHAVDQSSARINAAKENNAEYFKKCGTKFSYIVDDFSNTGEFFSRNKKWALDNYDIILLLGVFHHLKDHQLDDIIKPIFEKANKYVISRGSLFEPSSNIRWAKNNGFCLVDVNHNIHNRTGTLFIFERK
jgi:2-polyprenyl-3-methyl-5-hydroxy-6-metoxy-1,4-benzoquinol methylase